MMNRDNEIMGPSDSELAEMLVSKMDSELRYGATFQTADLREIAVGLLGPRRAVERLTRKLRLLG